MLGGSYKKLAPLIKLTDDEFNNLAESAPNVVSEETIRASEQLNDTIDKMKQGFQALLAQGLSKVIPVITQFIKWIQTVAVPAFKKDLQPALKQLAIELQSLKGTFEVVMQVVTAVVETAVKLIGVRIKTVIGIFSGLIMFVKGVFTGDWQLAWDGIKKIFESFWNGIKDSVSIAIGFLKNIFSVFGVDVTGIFNEALGTAEDQSSTMVYLQSLARWSLLQGCCFAMQGMANPIISVVRALIRLVSNVFIDGLSKVP